MKKFAIGLLALALPSLAGCAQLQRIQVGKATHESCSTTREAWAWADASHTNTISSSQCALLELGYSPVMLTDPLHRVWVMVHNPYPDNGYTGCIQTTLAIAKENGWTLC